MGFKSKGKNREITKIEDQIYTASCVCLCRNEASDVQCARGHGGEGNVGPHWI